MLVTGNWLDRVDTAAGIDEFVDMYDKTPDEIIAIYGLERIPVPADKRLIVFPEDGMILQSFLIHQPDDKVFVWSEGCCDMTFNTSGIAFMELERDGEVVARWSIENSPYEMNDEDLEEMNFDMKLLPTGIRREHTIFVQQL